jgi:hypothetical protein
MTKTWLDWHTKTFRNTPVILKLLRLHPENLKATLLRFPQWLMGLIGLSFGLGVHKNQILSVVGKLKPVSTGHELIRIGGSGDGGYLVPDDLVGVEACFSPGVALNASFEAQLAERGIRSFMADYSVDSPPIENPLFDFQKKFLGVDSSEPNFIRLDEWVEQKYPDGRDLILQMDIEGAEWPILADAQLETLRRFRIVVLEIHDLDVMLTSTAGLRIVEAVFQKLQSVFVTAHIHANNCTKAVQYRGAPIPPILEVTLLRKDRCSPSHQGLTVQIPHPLDQKNVPYFSDVRVPAYWYK